MVESSSPRPITLFLVLVAGVLAVSTAAIFIRLAYRVADDSSIEVSLLLAAIRLIGATLFLIPVWFRTTVRPSAGAWKYALVAGVFLAIHFAAWSPSFAFTSIAAATTIATTSPVWIALILWWWKGETPTWLRALSIAVALAGGAVIALGDLNTSLAGSNPLFGNGLALIAAFGFSGYFLAGREAQERGLGLWHYVSIAYPAGAVVLLAVSIGTSPPLGSYPPLFYLYGFLLALIPQMIGHTTFNWAAKWIGPTNVSLIILLEPVSSSVLGFFLLQEIPGWIVLAGALLMLCGVAGSIIGGSRVSSESV